MRIAVIQIGMPVQSYTRDLANGLLAQGCTVEILTRAEDFPGFIDPDSLDAPIRFLKVGRTLGFFARLRAKVAEVLGLPIPIHTGPIHRQAQRILSSGPRYDLLIGIEKAGLEIAAHYARKTRIPFVYYSLELYIEDHPDFSRFRWQRRSEIACHRHASATIIQDTFRWKSLTGANSPESNRVFYLPVGVPSAIDRPVPTQEMETTPTTRTVLYLGMIRQSRFACELVHAAVALPEGTVLHLHGPLSEPDLACTGSSPRSAKVKITTNRLTEAAVRGLVASADIGLALYRRDYDNDRLTAFSSQKIALYLREGIPVIAFRSETYEELFGRFRCGEMIDSIDELAAAVELIRSRRTTYSEAARAAFDEIYDLDKYWQPLVSFLHECASDECQ